MTEQRYDFIQGFMTAINLYEDNPFAPGNCWQDPNNAPSNSGAKNGKKRIRTALAYEKYLEIPTYIRIGKNLHI